MDSIRFSGLASGLDTQSIVDSMMKAERMPLDRMKQKQQVVEWQRDKYRDMNKLLKEFDTFIFDGIFRQSNMLKKTVTSSNTDFVTATASSDAGQVSYKIENVTLATSARRESTAGISASSSTKLDSSKSLWSQRDKVANSTDIGWEQEAKNQTFTAPKGGASQYQLSTGAVSGLPATIDVKNADGTAASSFQVVEGAIPALADRASDKVYIDSNTGLTVFGTSLEEGQKFDISYEHNYIEFNIKTLNEDGTANVRANDFKFSGTTSLNTIFSEINKSNVGINMFYDSGSDKVVAQRQATGNMSAGPEMLFLNSKTSTSTASEHSFFTSVLKIDDTSETDGTDAQFTINGLQTSRKSNTFTMNDVTFTLKKSSASETATVNVNSDNEAIFDTVKKFIEKYNEMIGKINGELTAERYSSFLPLTDEQRQAMGEKEIEQWEEKAKSGLLRRDFLLNGGLTKMRTDLYTGVTVNAVTRTSQDYNQLAEIGIKTTKDYLERGKLEIDETKLKAAIEDNPEAVYQLFMADGPTYQEKGVARRLRSTIDETLKKIEEKAGNTFKTEHNYSMGKDILRMKSSIESFEERLKMREQRYWDQFNAMEKAMQQMNNQSSQLMAQLGSMMQSG